MSPTPVRILTGIRNNVVTAVLSDIRRQSGWTAPQTILAERLRSLLLGLGPAVLVGMSTDQPSTSFLPSALHEATIALDFASVTKRVVQFSDLPIRSLMLHRGGDYVRLVAPNWVAALINADPKAKGSLIRTLQAVADADMNVQKAGRQLRRASQHGLLRGSAASRNSPDWTASATMIWSSCCSRPIAGRLDRSSPSPCLRGEGRGEGWPQAPTSLP